VGFKLGRARQAEMAGGSLKTWVKQDWRQVGNPSKKCGEK